MRSLALIVAILVACVGAVAQANRPGAPASEKNPPAGSTVLPSDKHDGLTISVDPYTDSQRAKDKFGKSANPLPAGILPVEVFLTNETPHPLKVDLATVQLEVHFERGKQDLDWLSVRRVATLIVHPGGVPASPSERRFPIGIPTASKDKKVDSISEVLRPFALDSDVIPPLGKIHGFLFFNVSHDFEAALQSSLYVPDVVVLPDKTPMMFFEVPLTRKK
ncbi:MAG TPA: hypothetical protein VLY23_18855 [Candidatus Acidoferrum sp.]|nr:hypothetical protein [Candidatus Acidoferrum sp.]